MSVRNYIQNARNSANQNYMSWTGDAAPQNGGYRNLVAKQFDTAAPVGSNILRPASSTKYQCSAISTVQYLLLNASATAVSNFDVLGAFTYIGNAGFSNEP